MSERDIRSPDGRAGHYAARQASPDLDASAPVLRTEDMRRLNRKALVFLAGIVLLLVLAVVWTLRAVSGEAATPAGPREQALVIPELPRTAAPREPNVETIPPMPAMPIPVMPSTGQQAAPALPTFAIPRAPAGPSLRERRMQSGDGDRLPKGPDAYMQAMLAGLPAAESAQVEAEPTTTSRARHITRPDALLVRGTYIRCVLETRIITDIPGFTSCVVTEPVYSINGRQLLLPRGSKVLGRYDTEPTGPRVAVVWDRISTPGGLDVAMASPGVDNLGGAGHPGDYSAHWGSRVASALLISLLSDAFKYAAAEEGPTSSTIGPAGVVVQSPYESATGRTMERLANQALDSRRPPTVTIQHGTVVNVYVARDVDFSAVVAKL
ncbi:MULTISPECIES: TrbI/VirB10 family protein [unclassified Luteimonas]|uniref:TrbI/VirB10 family protein n=1 Tax=unclassified Luteimonas TaxID=2629088 RepID=UPI0015FFE5C0|nr:MULTISPECIES: TrbI/VirB10 family protein [unclassified Luteimonas]MBB1471444.1 TrbI/VirB10 family protein [Luteimonas sp. MC1782]MBB6599817.1 TrbI/VirB10 family protein [Luteimonas sp. MC1825]QOC87490.1 TrbI/VirB10 family protein [Luteimonas sp. MC1825]